MEHNLSQREVLDIITNIGYHILRHGGEANRAEDTARRIGAAYGMDSTHVFAIPTSIIITVEKDGETLTRTRRITRPATDLDRVNRYNDLSRKICTQLPSCKEITDEIKKIESRPVYSFPVSVVAFALIGGAFAVFFGGSWQEFLVSFIVGALLRFVMAIADFLQSPPFFATTAGSAATVILIHISTYIMPALNTEIATIGVLMNLVPGVLLTNCIRDFIATDYSAGLSKIVEALFIAAAIALGVGVSVLWR